MTIFDELSQKQQAMLFKVGNIETNKLRNLNHLKEEIRQEYWVNIFQMYLIIIFGSQIL